jgi:REP element-mobilizing transposase RayT
MSVAWNGWYHITAHTYGSWPRGDPRGWRTRHHREHVEGDYKNPPVPETWARLFAQSKRLMKRGRVRIDFDLREFVLDALVDKLLNLDVEVIAAALTRDHLHLLGRFGQRDARTLVGLAKKHASHLVRQAGLRTDAGGLWGKRSRAEPVAGRHHQLRVVRYVLDHGDQGGATWFFLDGFVRPPRRP